MYELMIVASAFSHYTICSLSHLPIFTSFRPQTFHRVSDRCFDCLETHCE